MRRHLILSALVGFACISGIRFGNPGCCYYDDPQEETYDEDDSSCYCDDDPIYPCCEDEDMDEEWNRDTSGWPGIREDSWFRELKR